MIATKRRVSTKQPQPTFILLLQWMMMCMKSFFLAIWSFLRSFGTQVILILASINHAIVQNISLFAIYEILRVTLVAHGIRFPSKIKWPSVLLFTTDDELENCLEYTDLILSDKSPSNTSWIHSKPPASSKSRSKKPSNTSVKPKNHTPPSQPHTDNPKNFLLDSSLASNTVEISINDFATSHSDNNALMNTTSPSNSSQPALLQPKHTGTTGKKKRGNTVSMYIQESNESAKSKKSAVADSELSSKVKSSVSSIPQVSAQTQASKYPKKIKTNTTKIESTASIDDKIRNQKSRNTSSNINTKSVLIDSSVPTGPASFKAADYKLNKKQKQWKPVTKKKSLDTLTNSTFSKPSKVYNAISVEDKGFKPVKKKTKKKKSSSVDSFADKTDQNVVTNSSQVFEQDAPKAMKNRLLLETGSQDISDIMDEALQNVGELSDEDSEINRHSSPVSSVSSCSSPIIGKWPLDHRYLAFSNASSSSPVLRSSKLFDSFSNQNSVTPVFYNNSYPQTPSPYGFSQPYMSQSGSPYLNDIWDNRRQNTRITNSALTWSVPEHLQNN